jgi:hypothetical protein
MRRLPQVLRATVEQMRDAKPDKSVTTAKLRDVDASCSLLSTNLRMICRRC